MVSSDQYTVFRNGNRLNTPDDGSVETPDAYRGFLLPQASREIQACFDGIFGILFEERNWKDFGNLTVEQTAQYFRNITVMENLCQAIVDNCFNDDEFRDALTQLLSELGYGQGGGSTGEPVLELDGKNLNMNSDCTDNGTYGVAYAIVDQLNTVSEDLIDVYAQFVGELELANELAETIPVVGEFLSTAFDIATYLLNEVISDYNTAWNTAVHDQLACEVWQFMCDDCQISLQELQQAYKQFVPSGGLPSDFASWVQWAEYFLGVSLGSSVEIVATFHLFCITVWRMGSALSASTQRQLQIASSVASPLAPPVGCDCNSVWCFDFDFRVSDYSTYWTITGTTAVWQAGIGYVNNGANPNIYANLYNPDGNILTYVEIEYSISGASGTNTAKIQARSDFDKQGSDTPLISSSQNGNNLVKTWSGSQQAKSILSNPSGTGIRQIHRIKIRGRGSNPFGSSNC